MSRRGVTSAASREDFALMVAITLEEKEYRVGTAAFPRERKNGDERLRDEQDEDRERPATNAVDLHDGSPARCCGPPFRPAVIVDTIGPRVLKVPEDRR